MDKHSESVCRSTVWNLLSIASRVWPAVSCQVPCVGGGCSLLCAQSAIPDVDGVMHCMPKLPLAREAHDASAQFSDRAVDTGRHKGHMWKGMLRGNRWTCNNGKKIAPCWETASPEGAMPEQGSIKKQGSMEENE